MIQLYQYKAEVITVVDGDTVDLKVDLGFRTFIVDRFRLYGPDPAGKMGLNAPELKTEEGKKAKEALQRIINGLTETYVKTVKDKKCKYGRPLAVLVGTSEEGEVNVNQKLLDGGWAALKEY